MCPHLLDFAPPSGFWPPLLLNSGDGPEPHTQREKSSSVKITGICTRGKIKFAVKRGLMANLECEGSTPFTQA